MRAPALALVLLAGCTVERAPEPAATAQALTGHAHELVVLSFDRGRSEVSYARRVNGPLPVPRAPQPHPWRVVLSDAGGATLYETRGARADRLHAGEALIRRDRFVLMVRLPVTAGPARVSVFDGDVLLAAPVEVPP